MVSIEYAVVSRHNTEQDFRYYFDSDFFIISVVDINTILREQAVNHKWHTERFQVIVLLPSPTKSNGDTGKMRER